MTRIFFYHRFYSSFLGRDDKYHSLEKRTSTKDKDEKYYSLEKRSSFTHSMSLIRFFFMS
jgi:hypothetical protein